MQAPGAFSDPFAEALEDALTADEARVSSYLTRNAGKGPNIDLFLSVCSPQVQSSHERIGSAGLAEIFGGRTYWCRRARMLLGDYVPYFERVADNLDGTSLCLVFENYVAVMLQVVAGFVAVKPDSAEAREARAELREWIDAARGNVEEVMRELNDIVRAEMRLDYEYKDAARGFFGGSASNDTGGSSTAALQDPFAACVEESTPAVPPDRSPMIELAAIVCRQELAARSASVADTRLSATRPAAAARPPTPRRASPAESDDEGPPPRNRRLQQSWVFHDASEDAPDDDVGSDFTPYSPPPPGHQQHHQSLTHHLPRERPCLGYGLEDERCPFLLP